MPSPAAVLKIAIAPLVQFALPPRCPACGVIVEDDDKFCLACWQSLDHLGVGCPQCGDPAMAARDSGELCANCIAYPPSFDTMRAAVAYGDISRGIALRLKYGGRIGLARLVAKTMARQMEGLEDALIAPVPLHRHRIWRRGYNQAALIAGALVGDEKDRLYLNTLSRVKPTPYLRGMSGKDRAKTVRGVFAIPKPKRAAIKGRRVVLIDDVYTTGSTARACSKALRRHGVAEVHVRCWARVARDEIPAY